MHELFCACEHRPPLEEVVDFLQRLPTSCPLEEILPSLREIRRLELPWKGVLESLERLPFVSCRWRDNADEEHLILLESDDTDDEMYLDGRLTWIRITGGAVHVHACCMALISPQLLLTHINTSIAGEVLVWLWEHMALSFTARSDVT